MINLALAKVQTDAFVFYSQRFFFCGKPAKEPAESKF